jgi:hypothetical protein
MLSLLSQSKLRIICIVSGNVKFATFIDADQNCRCFLLHLMNGVVIVVTRSTVLLSVCIIEHHA